MQKTFWFIALIIFPLSIYFAPMMLGHIGYLIAGLLFIYVIIGLHDLWFSHHTLNRLYPVAAYLRYALEYIRPEIQQYFIASNISERPFNREHRSLVYRRAKQLDDTEAFGTQHDLVAEGWTGTMHSIAATTVKDDHKRVTIGGAECKKPYSASRLNCSAMSFGALSGEAITALNKAAKLGDFYHNTGEGGFSPYHQQGGAIVWQIGTGYFGCRKIDGDFDPEIFKQVAANEQIKMIEIKISQGAKPSHGGVLPAAKVTEEIAKIRLVEPGKDVISPPNHRTFSTPVGLLEFVKQLRELTDGKPVGFKLCIGYRHEFMAICKAMLKTGIYPDFITIDGAEGGTGAAPVEYSNRLGLSCIEGIDFAHNCLVGAGLRDKLTLIGSGKTPTGFSIIEKIAAGANVVNAARTMMLSLGCIQSQKCNTNTCPTGIATQDKKRSKALDVETRHKHAANFQRLTLASAYDMIGAMGFDNPDDIKPHLIWRRDAKGVNTRFDELYTQLSHNELLSDNPDPVYAQYWAMATADSFRPTS
tara:strand:+ start:423 stop:2012 length:1590 start_codon:yes stop_codon:yes gene_type:complete